jgi:hypothetical protein
MPLKGLVQPQLVADQHENRVHGAAQIDHRPTQQFVKLMFVDRHDPSAL